MTKKSEWLRLEAEAAKLRSNDLAQEAICFAEINANETENVVQYSDEWYDVAYSSIAFTSSFDENKSVREWFERIGYRW